MRRAPLEDDEQQPAEQRGSHRDADDLADRDRLDMAGSKRTFSLIPSPGTSTIQARAAASAAAAALSARARPVLMSGTAGAVVVIMCVLPHVARGARLRR